MLNIKILIVDDEPENLKVLAEMLQESFEEANIIQTNKVDSAIKIAQKTVPDIIVTDWNMPEKSGIDLLEEMKAIDALKKVPVIMATGIKMSSEDLKRAFDAGATDYVRKPFDKIELAVRIKSAYQIYKYGQQELDIINRSLAENTLLLLQSNEFNLILRKRLENVIERYESLSVEASEELRKIIEEVDEKARLGSWKKFELAFETSHQTFKKNLLEKFPNLTKSEIKLSIFLRLGMSTKDIASVLYLSQDSIKVSRSRLRKKLGLSTEQTLQVFLSRF